MTLIPKIDAMNIVRHATKGAVSGDTLPIRAWLCDGGEPTEKLFMGGEMPAYGACREALVNILDVLTMSGIPVTSQQGVGSTHPAQKPAGTLRAEVVGCYEAAIGEGLIEALAETTDERLKDLVERRLMHALYAAQAPQPAQQERTALFQYLDQQVAKDMAGFYAAFGMPVPQPEQPAQPGAEPVAWMFEFPGKRISPKFDSAPHGGNWKPLYTAPQPAQQTEQQREVNELLLRSLAASSDLYKEGVAVGWHKHPKWEAKMQAMAECIGAIAKRLGLHEQ